MPIKSIATRTLRCLAISLALVTTLASADPDAHVVPISHVDSVGSAFSANGKVNLELREVRLTLTGPYGKPVLHRMFLIFEPQSEAFSWTVGQESSPTNPSEWTDWFKRAHAVFIKDGCLVTFAVQNAPTTILVRTCAGHAATMDEAERKALRSVAEFNEPPGEVDSMRPNYIIPLSGLSRDFVHEPENAVNGPDTQVIDVKWRDKQWIITLKARWTEEVTLDPDYNLVSMKKIESPILAEAHVTVGRDVRQEVRVASEAGSSTATLSVTQAHTVLAGGKIVDGSIIGLFDPSSRLFWWMHQSSSGVSDPETVMKEFLNSVTFSVHPDEIVCFSPNGRTLWVLASVMRVLSMDEGVSKALKLLPAELQGFTSGKTLEFQPVPLAGAVGQKFLSPKDFGDPPIRLKVSAVHRSASRWTIEITNERGESKIVNLSGDFKTVTSASD